MFGEKTYVVLGPQQVNSSSILHHMRALEKTALTDWRMLTSQTALNKLTRCQASWTWTHGKWFLTLGHRVGTSNEHMSKSTGKSVWLEYKIFTISMFILLGSKSTQAVLSPTMLGHHSAYCQTSNIRCTLVGNKIVDHSDVAGAALLQLHLHSWLNTWL